MKFLSLCLIVTALLISACSNQPRQSLASAPLEYCDSYFIYDMCIKDVNADGQADLMYFQDTDEIFMLVKEFFNDDFAGLIRHKCLQEMDDGLRNTSTKVLAAQLESTVLERAQLKSQLILHYTRYLTKINRCFKPNDKNTSDQEAEEDFGDEEFDDF